LYFAMNKTVELMKGVFREQLEHLIALIKEYNEKTECNHQGLAQHK